MMQRLPSRVTATRLAQMLDKAEISAVELLREYLGRIEDHDDQSVFIKVTRERAFREAKASDERRRNGTLRSPWDGVPIAWKDLFDTVGEPTTAGSKIYANAASATQDAFVVAQCNRRGLVCLGKTNLSEFAYSGLGLNPHFGTPINPHSGSDPRAPGGSSSGSAVAVATDLAPVAIGTDTAGSVRVPASFCGILGFKSSQKRYSNHGVFPLSSSLDSLGAFAHCVDDLIIVDAMMRGQATPAEHHEAEDLEFVIPETLVLDDVEPVIMANFEESARRLKRAGIKVCRAPFPIFEAVAQLFKSHGTLTVAEAATFHEHVLDSPRAELMDRRVRERMCTARGFTAQDYIKLQWERERLQSATAREMGNRLLLFPTVAIVPPSIKALEASDEHFAMTNLMALRNTMLGNYLGTPGVSFPSGHDQDGMPTGVLISGPFGQDDRILAAARAIEPLLALA